MSEPGPSDELRKVGRAFDRSCRGRRAHPTLLRLGVLAGENVLVPWESATDAGLRADLLERLLDGIDPATAVAWFTRAGALAPGDTDLAWYAAARAAFGRHGQPLRAFYVITREGWFDLVTDRCAPWRPRRPGS